jgi:methionine-rich copper-binding protein CopC
MRGNIYAVLSTVQISTELVENYYLSQNFPNPFNPETKIKFSIPSESNVVLTLYNNQGQEVETLINENLSAGTYQADWNAVNFTSGIYYYKLQTDNFVATRKMLLIK